MQQTVIDNINDQPRALKYALTNKSIFIEPFVDLFKNYPIKKVYFIGSGTSYNVSQIAAFYFNQIAGVEACSQYPTVFKNYEKVNCLGTLKNNEILCVGISQSGTSISTCEALEFAKAKGYLTLAITGNLTSRIVSITDVATHLLVGDEFTPPETKGYTVSVLSVYLWAIAIAKVTGVYGEEKYNKAIKEANIFVNKFQQVLDESMAWYDRNKVSIIQSDRIHVLGYGVDYGSVLEAILKVGEMLRIPTMGYQMEEFAHGPTMGIQKNQSILIIGSEEIEFNRMLMFRKAFKKYTERVHVITCVDMDADERDIVFTIKANKYLAPLMYTVPFQLLAAIGAKDIFIDTSINPFEESLAHIK